MAQPTYVLVHDVGTTGVKSCIYRLDGSLSLAGSALEEYPLYLLPGGGAEQSPDEWWQALAAATQGALSSAGIAASEVRGMAFCAQMQGFVPVDRAGHALRNAMSYLDSRATAQIEKHFYRGPLRIGRWNAPKLLRWLAITGGAAASVKDPLWKYLWLQENEPAAFRAMHAWLDVKDYLVLRSTGTLSMGYDSAHATFLFDTRPNRLRWHLGLCRTFGVDPRHLPPVVQATDIVGRLSARAARELGLAARTPVLGGGGDLSLISIGSGGVGLYDTHIYVGTSGWVVSSVDRRMTDINGMVASILSAVPGRYNYIAEQETAGRCLQWARDHLVLDGVGAYPGARQADANLYDLLNKAAEEVEPGAGGVLFAPWLHGNRSPFEDPLARGIFFNIGLETGKRQLIRAVLEGVAFHMRWLLETVEKKVPRQGRVRFVGGGAQSRAWAQIMADVTGRTVEVVENAHHAGAVGAAIVSAVGLGLHKSGAEAAALIRVRETFRPRPQYRAIYERSYAAYRDLYRKNRQLFRRLNAPS